jgi:hypothetical protein
MKLADLKTAEVMRQIRYKYEVFDEKTSDNRTEVLEVSIWFRRNQITYATAKRFDGAAVNSDQGLTVLADTISRWSFDEPPTVDVLADLPQDLLTALIESFISLLSGSPMKPKP